ncbi:hypothetical protein BaRGS_00031351 [Batillaria attramentaria]|uniref:Uncharacterized protein n=1 Tax=Batillaria attramentaria TaxID=370345 RepID=A0ABD0JRS8_9CAEN
MAIIHSTCITHPFKPVWMKEMFQKQKHKRNVSKPSTTSDRHQRPAQKEKTKTDLLPQVYTSARNTPSSRFCPSGLRIITHTHWHLGGPVHTALQTLTTAECQSTANSGLPISPLIRRGRAGPPPV